ncbi:hypothetical protein FKM82_019105 [Ascaphus truei]
MGKGGTGATREGYLHLQPSLSLLFGLFISMVFSKPPQCWRGLYTIHCNAIQALLTRKGNTMRVSAVRSILQLLVSYIIGSDTATIFLALKDH